MSIQDAVGFYSKLMQLMKYSMHAFSDYPVQSSGMKIRFGLQTDKYQAKTF